MICLWVGREDLFGFWDEVREVKGGTLSPGGVVQLLGVSRQRVGQLYDRPDIRVWALREKPTDREAAYVEISAVDVINYGLKMGRFSEGEKLAFGLVAKHT